MKLPPSRKGSTDRDILIEVLCERIRQDERWKEQNHKDGTGGLYYENMADIARQDCEASFAQGHGTWRHILEEEVWEAFAESDPERLREELLQVAAVCVNWVGAIDRRIGPPLRDPLLVDFPEDAGEG